MTTVSTPATTGHNNPPSDLELLENNLTARYKELFDKASEYIKESTSVPDKFTEQLEADYISDRVKEIQELKKDLEAARKEEKAPFWTQGLFVDKFFNTEINNLDHAMLIITRPLHVWLSKQAATEQAARQADSDKLAREAALAIRDVQAAPTQENLDRAMAFQGVTEIAKKIASVPVETMAAASGKFSRATLKKKWVGIITELPLVDMEKLRPYLSLSVLQVALNAYVKAGGRDLAGCVIKEEIDTAVK